LPLLLLNNNNNDEPEDNNNGDINGNSDMVDHNLVHHRQQHQQQQFPAPGAANIVSVTATVHHRGATAGTTSAVSPAQQRRPGHSSVRASPVLWHPTLPSSASGSLSAVHQAALAPSRHLYRDDSSSSDSE